MLFRSPQRASLAGEALWGPLAPLARKRSIIACDIDVYKRQAPLLYIPEAADEFCDGRFSAAAGPDEGNHAARGDAEADVVEDLRVLVIAEGLSLIHI